MFETLAMSLLAFGSDVNDSTMTVLVIVLPSTNEQFTLAKMVAVTVAPGASKFELNETMLPEPLHDPRLELQKLKVIEGGSSSVTTTEKEGSGPSLVSVML